MPENYQKIFAFIARMHFTCSFRYLNASWSLFCVFFSTLNSFLISLRLSLNCYRLFCHCLRCFSSCCCWWWPQCWRLHMIPLTVCAKILHRNGSEVKQQQNEWMKKHQLKHIHTNFMRTILLIIVTPLIAWQCILSEVSLHRFSFGRHSCELFASSFPTQTKKKQIFFNFQNAEF